MAPLGLVVAKCPVCSDKLHATDLTLPGVPEHSVGLKAVLVAVQISVRCGEEKDNRMLRGSRHASLLLASKSLVEKSPLELLAWAEFVWERFAHVGNLSEAHLGRR